MGESLKPITPNPPLVQSNRLYHKNKNQLVSQYYLTMAPEKQQRERLNAILATISMEDCMRRSGSFHSEHESFFSRQYFGGDDLPAELAHTSLAALHRTRTPRVAVIRTPRVAECRADCRQLTICHVANTKVDDAPKVKFARLDSHVPARDSVVEWI